MAALSLFRKPRRVYLNQIDYGSNTLFFPVNALTLGLNYDLLKLEPLSLALGGSSPIIMLTVELNP